MGFTPNIMAFLLIENEILLQDFAHFRNLGTRQWDDQSVYVAISREAM